jgi:hypothetical protein
MSSVSNSRNGIASRSTNISFPVIIQFWNRSSDQTGITKLESKRRLVTVSTRSQSQRLCCLSWFRKEGKGAQKPRVNRWKVRVELCRDGNRQPWELTKGIIHYNISFKPNIWSIQANYLQANKAHQRVAGSASATVFPILGHHISIDHIPSLCRPELPNKETNKEAIERGVNHHLIQKQLDRLCPRLVQFTT